MKLTGSAILAVAALVGLGLLYLRYKGAVIQAVQTTLNPASSENIVNQGVSATVTAAVGHEETLGGWLYDLTHKSVNPQVPAPPITPGDQWL